jgi:septum formation protein
MPPLILASESPRRRELLTVAGFDFTIRARPVEEIHRAGEDPGAYVERLARSKAEAAWEGRDEIVLGADTTVVREGRLFEKPDDAAHAIEMLRALAGRDHVVITGVCLRHAGGVEVARETTLVRFAAMSDAEIAEYVASGEPLGKAGAYAIQGRAAKFVERIEGCYFNVMGLPIALVYQMWKRLVISD